MNPPEPLVRITGRTLQETAVRYFLEVVRCRSITEAAERLNVVPSAVSKQISRLEASLNTPLFERRSRGMIPNAAGELLAAYAFRNQLETERVTNEIVALQGLQRGEVRIACTASCSMELIPRCMVEFRKRYPGINFQVEVGRTWEISRMLHEAEADLGLTFSHTPQPGLNVEFRIATPIMAIMHQNHPLAQRTGLSVTQLVGHPLGLPSRGILTRQIIDACCSNHGISLNTVLSTDSMASLLTFAHAEGGITIGAAQLINRYLAENKLAAIPVRDRWLPPMIVEIHSLAGRTLPLAVTAFLEDIKTALQARCVQQ